MADLATVTDVERNWRSLQGQETVLAATLLRTASGSLRVQVPDVDARILAEATAGVTTQYADLVRGVVALAVVRVLRGKDRNDPATYDSIFFSRSDLDRLRENASTGGLPVGSFPDVVCYPVF